jgi:hypothetical protein
MILFPTIKLYEPTFLYSYCALIIQGGILQVMIFFNKIINLLISYENMNQIKNSMNKKMTIR